MAAARFTHPNVVLQRKSQATYCPTCGQDRIVDTKLGALNKRNFCSSSCEQKYRITTVGATLYQAGLDPDALGLSPTPLGS